MTERTTESVPGAKIGLPPENPSESDSNRPDFLSELRARQARSIHRSYYAWLRLSRLAMAGFAITAVLFFLWAIPWLPSGMSTSDYTPEMAFTMYLIGGTALLGLTGLAFNHLAHRRQATLMAWSAVYDQKTGLYNRAYLYNLLSLECDRSLESKSAFSLLVFQFHGGSSVTPDSLRSLAEVIRRTIRSTDVVALLSDSELAVLALDLRKKQRTALIAKLDKLILGSLPKFTGSKDVQVLTGAATYGADGEEPGAIIQAARSSATANAGIVQPDADAQAA
jgi:GGDEF domain-containing protein